MITFRQLFSVCLFGHGDQIFDRDQGVLVFRCLACGQISHTPDLSKDSHQGIAHQRPVILGEPVCKAKKTFARVNRNFVSVAGAGRVGDRGN